MTTMDQNVKINAKRCIQMLLPSVPGPLVDYALNSSFASSIGAKTKVEEVPAHEFPQFTARKMDSGDFGELSLTQHIGSGRHLKNNSFGIPEQLNFAYQSAPVEIKSKRHSRSSSVPKDATALSPPASSSLQGLSANLMGVRGSSTCSPFAGQSPARSPFSASPARGVSLLSNGGSPPGGVDAHSLSNLLSISRMGKDFTDAVH